MAPSLNQRVQQFKRASAILGDSIQLARPINLRSTIRDSLRAIRGEQSGGDLTLGGCSVEQNAPDSGISTAIAQCFRSVCRRFAMESIFNSVSSTIVNSAHHGGVDESRRLRSTRSPIWYEETIVGVRQVQREDRCSEANSQEDST